MPVPEQKQLLQFYRDAKQWVDANSDWLETLTRYDLAKLTAQGFLCEYAWAVYVSGFRARTIKEKWGDLKKAWRDFRPGQIDGNARKKALSVIAHEKKADAILETAKLIVNTGWPRFKTEYCVDPDSLRQLPWMGPANRQYLARNLGLGDLGKPDIWLKRAREKFAFANIDSMLGAIRKEFGDGPGAADLYLWAYLSDNPDALG